MNAVTKHILRSGSAAVLAIALMAGATAAEEMTAMPVPPPPDACGLEGLPGMGPGRGMFIADGPGMMLPLLMRRADLTAEQRAKVHEIIASDHRSLRTLFDELRAANDELADKLLAPGQVEAKDLEPQAQKVARLREQLMGQAMKTAVAIREVLTPAQLAKAAETKKKLEDLRAQMRELMGGGE